MKGPTDSQLLGQALHGEKNLYLQLVDRYGPLVCAVVQHWIPEPEEAEQVVVAAFREAFLGLRRLPDLDKFYEELIRIARERAAARTGRAAPERAPLPEPAGFGGGLSPELFAALPRIVRWKYFEGNDYQQIAEKLGVSPDSIDLVVRQGRIWSRLQRAGAST